MKTPKSTRGFTLLELMITVGIVAILAAYAIPSMQDALRRNAVNALQRDLMAAFSYARDEALTRNKAVSICPSSDESSCGADWSGGWLVFVDNGEAGGTRMDGVLNGGETLLRSHQNKRGTLALLDPDNGLAALNSVTWTYRGFTFDEKRALAVICAEQDNPLHRRGLALERSGRVLKSRDFDNDGIHDAAFDSGGATPTYEALSCP